MWMTSRRSGCLVFPPLRIVQKWSARPSVCGSVRCMSSVNTRPLLSDRHSAAVVGPTLRLGRRRCGDLGTGPEEEAGGLHAIVRCRDRGSLESGGYWRLR